MIKNHVSPVSNYSPALQTPIQKFLITSKQLAVVINLSVFTIRQYTREKRIPSYKVGKHYLYDPDEVVSLIKKKNKIN